MIDVIFLSLDGHLFLSLVLSCLYYGTFWQYLAILFYTRPKLFHAINCNSFIIITVYVLKNLRFSAERVKLYEKIAISNLHPRTPYQIGIEMSLQDPSFRFRGRG